MSGKNENLLAANGCKHVSSADGATSGLDWYCMVVQEDSVITTLTETGSNNLLTSSGLGSKTLKGGAFITPTNGRLITNITLSSGSVIGYPKVL
jgi:hypothetical protein